MAQDSLSLDLLVTILVIVVLIALSAFFSGSETALTAASRARLHHLAQEGNRRAGAVMRLRERKEELLGALLLGNNLANILASALATSVLIRLFGPAGVVYATVAMTILVVIFAEVLPKSYAINQPDRTALLLARPARVAVAILALPARAVQWVVRLTLRLLGSTPRPRGQLSAVQELRGAIDLHGREAGVVKDERDMLDSILDLHEVQLADIMIHRKNMQMIDLAQPPAQIVEQVLASPHTRLPLWRDEPENIVGIVHAKDLLRALSAAGGELDKLDVAAIASPPWFVPETTSLDEQLAAFRARRVHFALVVDEYGVLMGLVTLEDILEEIVGDIRDEHDQAVIGVRPQADGSYLVDGTVTIRDLNRQFGWHLPDDEAATIAGLVIHEARILPEVGQAFSFHGFAFHVTRRQRNQITQLRVRPPAEATPGEGSGDAGV